MTLEWPIAKLSECATFQEGYVNPSQTVAAYFGDEIKWLRAVDLNDGYVFETSRRLSKAGFESTGKSALLFEPNTLAISKSGTIGRLGILRDRMCGNRAVINVKVDEGKCNTRFIFYILLANRPTIENLAIGSVQKNLYTSALGKLEFQLPPKPTQDEIAHILGTLDDKIELNRRMNETLEDIARAIFKSWFVDFDPVRAKASGEPPESICRRLGLTPDLLTLFPDRLVDSELGEIPEGWLTAPLYEMATYINGAAYSAFEPNEEQRGLPIIKIAELKAGVTAQTKYSDAEMPEKYQINRGDILFSWSGNPDTSIDTFVWASGPAWLNQHIFRVVPYSELERSFVLVVLKYLRPVFAEIARNKQTTGLGHVTVSDLKRLRCVKPPTSLLVCWNDVIGPILERAFLSGLETQTLANHRDNLLPKLFSGELRLPLAEYEGEVIA